MNNVIHPELVFQNNDDISECCELKVTTEERKDFSLNNNVLNRAVGIVELMGFEVTNTLLVNSKLIPTWKCTAELPDNDDFGLFIEVKHNPTSGLLGVWFGLTKIDFTSLLNEINVALK